MSIKEKIKVTIKENMSIVLIVSLGVVLIVGGMIYSRFQKPLDVSQFMEKRDLKECKTNIEKIVVDGGGNDVYAAGTELEVEMNYYNCNPGQRNEVVMIMSPGREHPIFKYIKMLPGDKFNVYESGSKKYRLKINGDDMKNSKDETYEFSERKSRMVKLYESNYSEGIRKGVYFVFGETLGGGFDSTRYGPVTNERMVGRVRKILSQKAVAEKPVTKELPAAAAVVKSQSQKNVQINALKPKSVEKAHTAKAVEKKVAAQPTSNKKTNTNVNKKTAIPPPKK